jgi:hypothetical protein
VLTAISIATITSVKSLLKLATLPSTSKKNEKRLDKQPKICYNKDTEREKERKQK